MARVLFYLLALGIVTLAIRMVTTQKLVRSLILHVITLFLLGLVYLASGAHLVGAVQVMVYAGSVTILLVFAIMLTPIGHGRGETLDHQSRARAAVAAAVVFALASYALLATPGASGAVVARPLPDVAAALFMELALPFELLSLVLIVALAGVAIVAGRARDADAEGSDEPAEPAEALP